MSDRPTPTFPVAEVFGPTIQGEGELAGAVSHFIRFGGCDFRCGWCDSAPAVLPELVRKLERFPAEAIAQKVLALPRAPWVTLTGGNPVLHPLAELVARLRGLKYRVAVETQGSVWRDWLGNVDLITASPKPPSSGMAALSVTAFLGFNERAEDYAGRAWLANHMVIKVAVYDREDFEWAAEIHRKYPAQQFFVSVVTRMGGLEGQFFSGVVDKPEELLNRYQRVAEWVLAEPSMNNVKVLPQLHVLLWGHERGH